MGIKPLLILAAIVADTLIDKCLSFDGQGFSKKLCETEDYDLEKAYKIKQLVLGIIRKLLLMVFILF